MAKHRDHGDEATAVTELVSILDALEDEKAALRVLRAVANIFDDNWWIESND